eukprot:CAMPEP_0113650450 /NCGR_PEP_ID=MMETSP0017_2-20120614/26850_1 /TAXON_ID=2856 /ORGANISM="Cylindrotheca closterium" /LENGTH=186 /DNA_ID=CAMNT_0000562973 /DNA_START=347 /DNA_END=907 /DNA_ORIENTATION=+ /assembly_acc=CAM_ASM_000147
MFRAVSRFATRPVGLVFPLQQLQQSQQQPLASLTARWSSTRTSNNKTNNDDKVFHRTSFVHPLSQVVLEYLQSRKSGWLLQQGLDHSLTINADGSFQLKYPTLDPNINQASIFTQYDRIEAKHYLVVKKGYLNERYMLQDNKASPWHANKKSVYDRIHVSVDEMIHAVERLDGLERERMIQRGRKQ